MRAAANADDIITATTAWANDGKLTHPRSDNLVDFAHGDVLILAGENKYKASTVVGITDGGEYVFYDVVDMKPDSFKMKEESSTTASDKNAVSDIQEDSSDEMVTDTQGKVKQRFSESEDDLSAKYPRLNLNEDITELDGVPAIELRDGSVLPLEENPGTGHRYTHVEFIEKNRIDIDDLKSGGWIGNGVYEPSYRSDTERYIERQQAKKRVAEMTGKPYQQFYSESEEAPAQQEQQEQQERKTEKLPRYVKTAAEDLRTDVMEAIGADVFHDMRAVQDAVDRMAREAYETGEISEKTRKAALDVMLDNARSIDSEMFDDYEEVRDDLRKRRIFIPEDVRSAIPDFENIRRRNTNRVSMGYTAGRGSSGHALRHIGHRGCGGPRDPGAGRLQYRSGGDLHLQRGEL